MAGFSEDWLKEHQAKMTAIKQAPPVPASAPAAPPKSRTGRTKQGWRPDIGIFTRSSWEANFARYLNWLVSSHGIKEWSYEPETFWFEAIKRGVRSYKPDFKIVPITGDPYFIELKGYMDPKSKTKLKRMAKYHPNVRVQLVGEVEYRAIARTVRPLIPTWEG